MKRALFLASAVGLSLALAAPALAAEEFVLDKAHTQILFEYEHLGFSITQGSFDEWEGALVVDPADPAASSLEVTIQTDSLDTGFADRDGHLKSPDFFDVATFPTAAFVSTDVEKTGEDRLQVTGDLTIHGTTQTVTLDVVVNQLAPHPMTDQQTLGFTATTQISRSDFGLGLYAPMVGDEVSIRISGEAIRKADLEA